jgi:hypothetical protein
VTFRLHVNESSWRAHLISERDRIAAAGATLVPVIKGNGYGFGRDLLLREAGALGADVVAVGTVFEARDVLTRDDHGFTGSVVVLTPWDLRDAHARAVWDQLDTFDNANRLVRTVSSTEMQARVGSRRHLVEIESSMSRFGIRSAVSPRAESCEGVSLHLPLEQPVSSESGSSGASGRTLEAIRALHSADASLWLSHLMEPELRQVCAHAQSTRILLRSGTGLWLGERKGLQAWGTVLAVHTNVDRPVGYRQRRGPRNGTLLIVGGGTAHGVALEAPTAARSVRARAVRVAGGVLEASGKMRSPFHIGSDGPRAWFAEPPHMQVSMLWMPAGADTPQVGQELPCDVRMTTATFDSVTLS